MYKLTNKLKRRIGLPAPKHGNMVLDVDESEAVTNEHYKELLKSKKIMHLISTGGLVDEKVELNIALDEGDS
jgi:hypothetical protein